MHDWREAGEFKKMKCNLALLGNLSIGESICESSKSAFLYPKRDKSDF